MTTQHCRDARESRGKVLDHPGIEPGTPLRVAGSDRAGHHIPRCKLTAGVELQGESLSRTIQQDGSRAPHRLGDQWRRIEPGYLERSWMKLKELDIS
jgi:hypothetical protein